MLDVDYLNARPWTAPCQCLTRGRFHNETVRSLLGGLVATMLVPARGRSKMDNKRTKLTMSVDCGGVSGVAVDPSGILTFQLSGQVWVPDGRVREFAPTTHTVNW